MNMISFRSNAVRTEQKEALFAEATAFAAEIHRNDVLKRRVAYGIGAAGAVFGLCGMVSAASLFPLKTTVIRFIIADSSTGFVGDSIAATDAPAYFNERTAAQYLRFYIEAREGYVPETDHVMYERVQIMSTEDERKRYEVWHKDPLSPQAVLQRNGHVEVSNFHPLLQGVGKTKTYVYHVRFDRRETRGTTIGPWKHWAASVDFQWHPELIMTDQERQVNAAGMQVLQYQANEEPQ